jgi:Fe-S cluster assembly ATP-binding protein
MNQTLLEIKNLEASIENKQIIKNFNLTINKNEIHVIMGPNGSGKVLSQKFCAGHPAYNVQRLIYSKDLLDMSPEVRSHEGLFFSISISN